MYDFRRDLAASENVILRSLKHEIKISDTLNVSKNRNAPRSSHLFPLSSSLDVLLR